jgi:transposase
MSARSGSAACRGRPKRQAIRKAIRITGAQTLLPPRYSPDLNPIEQV